MTSTAPLSASRIRPVRTLFVFAVLLLLVAGLTYWIAQGSGGLYAVGFAAASLTAIVAGFEFLKLRKNRPAAKSSSARADKKSYDNAATDDSQSDETLVEEPTASPEEQALADTLVSDGRYLLALRRQIADLIDPSARDRAITQFEKQMAIVPAGQVVIGPIDEILMEGELGADAIARCGGEVIAVDPYFLDRHPVTNEQFYRFVKSGGYEEIAIWDEEIWPEVLGLLDATGHSGPRYWRNGRFAPGEEKLPVVGVNWFEAVAYARWVGKRLPSDAEWVKASSWPVTPKSGVWLQRRFPWGNTFDHKKANIWGSGGDCLVPVDHFESGTSAGGASQMTGNVWEWTSCGFGRPDDYSLTLSVPMKSIRGGAFDTYFENHATCNFQSGENPLGQKHNIGFRLAVGACDISRKSSIKLVWVPILRNWLPLSRRFVYEPHL